MAKKLKPTQKLPEKKTSKNDVFNTGDKTLAAANKFANQINAKFISAMKGTNIPILMEFATVKNALDLYFMNRDMITYVMGDYQVIIDRIFKDILATEAASDVLAKTKENCIPGYWTEHGMMAICRQMVNIIQLADHLEYGAYLSAHIVDPEDPVVTLDMVKEYPAMTCMRFTDFNPNRLYQYFTVLKSTAIQLIKREVEDNIPLANLVDPAKLSGGADKPRSHSTILTKRYGSEFSQYIKEKITAWRDEYWDAEDKSLEWKLKDFSRVSANLTIGYAFHLVGTMGVSPNIIEDLQRDWEPKVSYNPVGIQHFGDITSSLATISILYKPKDVNSGRGPGAKITYNMGSLYRLATSPDNACITAFGRDIREFAHQLMNLCIYQYSMNPKVTPSTIYEDDSDTDPENVEEKIDI